MTTALRDAIDFTALGWVKPELDETLRQARLEIEAYAEDPDDTGRMRACAELMHQVQGSCACSSCTPRRWSARKWKRWRPRSPRAARATATRPARR